MQPVSDNGRRGCDSFRSPKRVITVTSKHRRILQLIVASPRDAAPRGPEHTEQLRERFEALPPERQRDVWKRFTEYAAIANIG